MSNTSICRNYCNSPNGLVHNTNTHMSVALESSCDYYFPLSDTSPLDVARKPIKMTLSGLTVVQIALIGLLFTTPTTKCAEQRCLDAQPECVVLGRFTYNQEFVIASASPSQDAGLSTEEFWVRRITKIIYTLLRIRQSGENMLLDF